MILTDQDQLDQAAGIVRRVSMQVGGALSLVTNAHRLEGEALRSTLAEVTEQAEGAFEDSKNAYRLLTAMGAHVSDRATIAAVVPLHLLSTDAGRNLLLALEAATEAAKAVDRERGWIDEDGEAIGYAETIGGIAIKLRGEISGPAGRD
jgi:hypothetical protein